MILYIPFYNSLQRIAQCTRRGGPDKLQMDRFTEALYDEDAGMTFPALTGQRKQSVQDAEILFSEGVERFMKRKGYKYEEKFVRIIRNWRRACIVIFLFASVQSSIMTSLTYCWMSSCPGTRSPTTSVCLKLLGKKYCTAVM